MTMDLLDKLYDPGCPDKDVMWAVDYAKWLQFLPSFADVSISTFSIGGVETENHQLNPFYNWMKRVKSVRVLYGNAADRPRATSLRRFIPSLECRYLKEQHSKLCIVLTPGNRTPIVYCGSMNLCYPRNEEVMAKVTQPEQIRAKFEELWQKGKNGTNSTIKTHPTP
jgi:hypothetical protein